MSMSWSRLDPVWVLNRARLPDSHKVETAALGRASPRCGRGLPYMAFNHVCSAFVRSTDLGESNIFVVLRRRIRDALASHADAQQANELTELMLS